MRRVLRTLFEMRNPFNMVYLILVGHMRCHQRWSSSSKCHSVVKKKISLSAVQNQWGRVFCTHRENCITVHDEEMLACRSENLRPFCKERRWNLVVYGGGARKRVSHSDSEDVRGGAFPAEAHHLPRVRVMERYSVQRCCGVPLLGITILSPRERERSPKLHIGSGL